MSGVYIPMSRTCGLLRALDAMSKEGINMNGDMGRKPRLAKCGRTIYYTQGINTYKGIQELCISA
jgi:hypothetical protein